MAWGFKLVKPGNSHFPVGRKKAPANETSVKGQQSKIKKKSLSVKHV